MACYVYYDQNGIIKEMVNSPATRKGDGSDVNLIYFYCDQNMSQSASVSFFMRKPDGTTQIVTSFSYVQNVQIPFDSNRILKYFQYYTNYDMYLLSLPANALDENGLLIISPTVGSKVYGAYNVVIENSAVVLDETMTISNFYYLLNYIQTAGIEMGDFNINDDGNLIWSWDPSAEPGTGGGGGSTISLATDNTWTGSNAFSKPIVLGTNMAQKGSVSAVGDNVIVRSVDGGVGMTFLSTPLLFTSSSSDEYSYTISRPQIYGPVTLNLPFVSGTLATTDYVKANTGLSMTNLTSIEIGGTIYNIPQGGGSGDATLSGNNTWTGTNDFNGNVTFNGTVHSDLEFDSASGFTLGNANTGYFGSNLKLNGNILTIPGKAGTIATLSDIPNLISSDNTWTGSNEFTHQVNVTLGTTGDSAILTNGSVTGTQFKAIGTDIPLQSTNYSNDGITHSVGVTDYNYTFPKNSGTFALTSDIPQANVQTSGSESLTNIQIGGVTYNVPQPAGTVVANPSSTTGFLSGLGIGGTNYALSGCVLHTLTWSGNTVYVITTNREKTNSTSFDDVMIYLFSGPSLGVSIQSSGAITSVFKVKTTVSSVSLLYLSDTGSVQTLTLTSSDSFTHTTIAL